MTPTNSPVEIKDINYSVNGITLKVRALMQMVEPVDLSVCRSCPAFNKFCDGPKNGSDYAAIHYAHIESQLPTSTDSISAELECESPLRSTIKTLSERLGKFIAVFKPGAGINRQAAQTIMVLTDSFNAVSDHNSLDSSVITN